MHQLLRVVNTPQQLSVWTTRSTTGQEQARRFTTGIDNILVGWPCKPLSSNLVTSLLCVPLKRLDLIMPSSSSMDLVLTIQNCSTQTLSQVTPAAPTKNTVLALKKWLLLMLPLLMVVLTTNHSMSIRLNLAMGQLKPMTLKVARRWARQPLIWWLTWWKLYWLTVQGHVLASQALFKLVRLVHPTTAMMSLLKSKRLQVSTTVS